MRNEILRDPASRGVSPTADPVLLPHHGALQPGGAGGADGGGCCAELGPATGQVRGGRHSANDSSGPGAAPWWLTPSGGVPGSPGPPRLDPKSREEPAGGHVTDRGGAGGPEIAAAAVPPAGCRERKAETGGRRLGAGAARPRPRRMLSPCPARPRAHDGDTGAQSVSSRGESCAALRRGHPRPCAPPPAAPCAPSPLGPLSQPGGGRVRACPEPPTRSARLARRPGSAGAPPRSGRPGPRDSLRGQAERPAPRSLRPPTAFSCAFDNFLPAETLSYSAKAPDPFCLPGGNGSIHFWGGRGEVRGVGKKAQPDAREREGMSRLEGSIAPENFRAG